MCKHVCYWRPRPTNEGDTQIGWRCKYEASPSATDPSKLVPPIFALPSPIERVNAVAIGLHQSNRRPAMVEDVEKGIIVEDINTHGLSIGTSMGYKRMPINTIEERSIPRMDYSNIPRKGGGR